MIEGPYRRPRRPRRLRWYEYVAWVVLILGLIAMQVYDACW